MPLAGAYIQKIHLAELAVTPIPVGTFARILSAEIMVSAHETLEGKVYIAIDALHVMLGRMTRKDIAVVGDNEPAQLALISAGIACLIIADCAPVGERVTSAASHRGVTVLSTPLDAFGVGRIINLSLPAREVMDTHVPVLTFNDTIAHARSVVSSTKFRAACVISPDGKLAGILTRTTLLDDVRRSVILLDHNEASHAVDGIGDAEIVEIIDHHRLGAISTLKPIKFLNDPVGATSTIIAMKFLESGLFANPTGCRGTFLRDLVGYACAPEFNYHPPGPEGGTYPRTACRRGSRSAWDRSSRTGDGSLRIRARRDSCPGYQALRAFGKEVSPSPR